MNLLCTEWWEELVYPSPVSVQLPTYTFPPVQTWMFEQDGNTTSSKYCNNLVTFFGFVNNKQDFLYLLV